MKIFSSYQWRAQTVPPSPSCSQFHQHYTPAFFVRIFQQSQNVNRKTMFVRNIRTYNADEIDTWGGGSGEGCQFHQAFYATFLNENLFFCAQILQMMHKLGYFCTLLGSNLLFTCWALRLVNLVCFFVAKWLLRQRHLTGCWNQLSM